MTELLSPAGNIEALDAALGEGADAVYMGLKSFNARLRSSNFAWNQFEAAVSSCHRLGKKIYVTVNTVSQESETERLYRFLSYLDKIGPDGIIVQDFGVIRMCQEFFPNLELHASTQMNVASAEAANLLSKQGLKRVVVARELGLEEVIKIKQGTNAELEMFVHGALCVSESGLCLFSSYLGGKSANRGMCTQACRRYYTAEVPGGIEQGYYFSPCDMQLINHIPELCDAGIDSFKIEGRMKSAEYVGSVTAAYRYVIDHYQQDRKGAVAEGKRMLATDFARSKTDYWYGFGSVETGVEEAGAKILNPKQAGGTGIYLGKIADLREASAGEKNEANTNLLRSEMRAEAQENLLAESSDEIFPEKNAAQAEKENAKKPVEIQMALLKGGSYDPDPGDSIRLHKSDDSGRSSHKVKVVRVDEDGRHWIDVPAGFTRGDEVYLLQTKSMSKRYKRILPPDLGPFRRQPGNEQLPVLDLTPVEKKEMNFFPEGLYIGVSTVQDAHVVQSMHPVRLLLELNSETEYDLLKKDNPQKPILPYPKKMVFINLDPFAAEGNCDHLKDTLNQLVEKGWTNFVVNNLAQINMLKGKKVNVMAGPYLYTFNRWAVSFLENLNVMTYISPLENSERNLDETYYGNGEKNRVLLTVFAYPQLFRMRFKLPDSYDFTYFSDKEGTGFKVNSTVDGSFVMPELPFSLLDKMNSLQSKGWTHQLIDFSKTRVLKSDVRDMMKVIQSHDVVQGASRFNWKDGFYDPEKIEAYQEKAAREAKARQFGTSAQSKNGNGRKKPGKKTAAAQGKKRR